MVALSTRGGVGHYWSLPLYWAWFERVLNHWPFPHHTHTVHELIDAHRLCNDICDNKYGGIACWIFQHSVPGSAISVSAPRRCFKNNLSVSEVTCLCSWCMSCRNFDIVNKYYILLAEIFVINKEINKFRSICGVISKTLKRKSKKEIRLKSNKLWQSQSLVAKHGCWEIGLQFMRQKWNT
jgi:hypothetical protein